MSEIYDVIILGAGPAGLAAGLYAGRSRLNVMKKKKGQDSYFKVLRFCKKAFCRCANDFKLSKQ